MLGGGSAAIASGFYVPEAGAGETDGPPGALAVGRALAALGISVSYVTDPPNEPYFLALGARPLLSYSRDDSPGLLSRSAPTHLVAVERAGRAADGRYYNMRGVDITDHTAPVDELFLQAPGLGITTIGIGDGGNEVGMGIVQDVVAREIPEGKRIASVVAADWLIVGGTSNWGAYGLVGALSCLAGRDLLPGEEEVRRDVGLLVEAGCVDGVTLKAEPTVDGTALEDSIALLMEIRAVL